MAAVLVVAGAVHWHLSARWSANPDEVPHLLAGLAYIHAGQYYHYSVNPPLVKNVAAFPAWLMGLRGPELGEQPGRPELRAGWNYAERYPEAVWRALVAGRRAMFLFTLVGALAVYRLARDTVGRSAGTLAAGLWLTLPPVVGQGAMVQCDIAGAAVGALAVSSIHRWTTGDSWWRCLETSLTLSLAILTKYTWLLLIYVLVTWALIDVLRRPPAGRSLRRRLSQLALMFAVMLAMLGAGFQFQDWGSSLRDGQWRSANFQRFSGTDNPAGIGAPWINSLASLPVPLPRPMLVGLDIQMFDLQRPKPAFYLGRWHDRGSWIYYPSTLAAKLPLAVVLLLLFGIAACLSNRAAMPLLYTPAILLAVLATSRDMNEHVRYAYGVLPFVAILAGLGSRRLWLLGRVWTRSARARQAKVGHGLALAFQCSVTILPVMSMSAATLRPARSFSYTNRLFGNTERAGRYIGGSAVDWDHLWIEARRWVEQHDIATDRLVALRPRWTPLTLCGWRVRSQPLHDFTEPLVALVPVDKRQRLEQSGYRCFQVTPHAGTIAGGLEVYRIDSPATLSGWPELVALELVENQRGQASLMSSL